MPDLPECQSCEFNRTLAKSQRGMLLVYASSLLFLMWVTQSILSAIYEFQADNTVPLIFGGAVAAGFTFYFYSKSQTDKANVEAKLRAV
jgi:hypothetical protein